MRDDSRRPYFQAPIEELEAIFATHGNDVARLADLLAELGHRTTQRALRLRQRVLQRVAILTPCDNHVPSGVEVTAAEHNDPGNIRESPPPRIKTPKEFDAADGPPITTDPEAVLSAWIALEVLSPPTPYSRPEDLVSHRGDIAELVDTLPWDNGRRSKPNYKLFYQIVLGAVKLEPALTRLTERYGDTRPDPPSTRREKAILATVLVDREGRLIESPAIAISSFAWGVMIALDGRLADLATWPNAERTLVERIEERLRRYTTSADGHDLPLTHAALMKTYELLVAELRLPREFVEPPSFAIRTYVWFKDPNPPEPLILNSFFLNDLAWARRLFAEGKAPETLRRYLGVTPPSTRTDVLQDETALQEAIAPKQTPLGRWPSPGRHSLVTLQQASVNIALKGQDGGILGVNGPPGTGKTTLLRDIVAGVVVERATAMLTFDDPAAAFTHSGEKLRAGAAWLHLYRVHPSLRGFELVVASTNNKAVENVSRELPGLAAIADDAPELRYFKSTADLAHGRDTWGMIAAVLGNAQNQSRFRRAFWWDEDLGMNRYLAAAAGTPQFVEEKDRETGTTRRRPPRVVVEERPPATVTQAQREWQAARKRFEKALQRSTEWQTWLEHIRARSAAIPSLIAAVHAAEDAMRTATSAETTAVLALRNAEETRIAADAAEMNACAALGTHMHARPGWFARLFCTARAREWRAAYLPLRATVDDAHRAVVEAGARVKRCTTDLTHATTTRLVADRTRAAAISEHEAAERELSDARSRGVTVVDDTFFAAGHAALHSTTPWYCEEAQRCRDEVFITAMSLHRAFIAAAAKPLRNNLGVLMGAFSGRGLPTEKKRALLSDLWASLFLVVPMISTTFASVERMLGLLPPQSLGWLLVDEAGQASPQAAVGALIRTRKALIIGDPMQIEPVVTLPDMLTTAICRHMGVDADRFGAPAASVQTLADEASPYASNFEAKSGSRTVGVPLLVHRRCSEPMFGISNAVAYAGLMVSAKKPAGSTIRDVLGPSAWFHVEGTAQEKWCAEEGAEVLRLLRAVAAADKSPDLFIITPFVIVAKRLRQLVSESGVLTHLGVDDEQGNWTSNRIGTVHTVQGREAEAVIFVLGAPSPAQTGARNWAGRRPNLLNVAVTRAKEALYVVGNRRLWREAGLFAALDERLP